MLLLGATLHEAVLQTLHEWGLALPRFLSCSTDGAGAMLGHRSGFHARVKADNQYAINVHCCAHRGGLTIRDLFDCHDYLKYTFKDSFRQLYDYHDNSAKRTRALQDVEEAMGLDSFHKLKEPSTTRWSYMNLAVARVYDVLPSLIVELHKYLLLFLLSFLFVM